MRTPVVIIDSEAANAALQSSLEDSGCRVCACEKDEIVAACHNEQADALVLDASAADSEAFRICSDIRKSALLEHVAIIALVPFDDMPLIAKAYAAGATDFANKNSNASVLAQRVLFLLQVPRLGQRLQEAQSRSEHIQAFAGAGSWRFDSSQRTVSITDSALAAIGLLERDATHLDALRSRVHPQDRLRLDELLLEREPHRELELRLMDAEKQDRMVRVRLQPSYRNAQDYELFVSDITHLRRAEARIAQLTYFDAESGLPNLQWLRERVTRSIEMAAPGRMQLAAIAVDVTRFERFSNTFGPTVGSALLVNIAERLQTYALEAAVHRSNRITESVGAMVARTGTHQFAIVLPLSREYDWIRDLLFKLTETLKTPFKVEGYTIAVDMNVGVSFYPDDATTAEMLLQNASAALEEAQQTGSTSHHFYSARQQQRALRRVSLESDLRGALEREELLLHFQPRIELASFTPIAAEALLRWKHPKRGWVSPTEFIPIAEEIGVIDQLWQWVLHEACRRAASCAEKTPVRIAVNVSGAQFRTNSIADEVKQALWCQSLDPSLLELEITEGVLIERPQLVHDTLSLIRDSGVQIALDDFGTGYSSLSYLRKLPLDYLKIDRTFIADLEDSGDGTAVVEAILALARTLNLRAVAEGVENEAQLRFIAERGCEECQGYFFAKPMPGDELERWLADAEVMASQRKRWNEICRGDGDPLGFLRGTGTE